MILMRKVVFLSFLVLAVFALVLGTSRELGSTPNESVQQNKLSKFVFSPDGRILASVSKNDRIILWDVGSGNEQSFLSGQAGAAITGLAYHPDGHILASADENSRISLWDVASGQERQILFSRIGSEFTDFAFSPDGRTLASIGKEPWITLWDVASGQAIQTFSGHAGVVKNIAFNPNGTLLASGSQDAQIKLWDIRSGQEILSLAGTNDVGVARLAFSPDGKSLASVDEADRIMLWDMMSGRKRLMIAGPVGASVTGITWSPDGNTLTSGGAKAQIVLWDAATGQRRFSLAGQSGDIFTKVIFSPDGEILASVSQTGQIALWDATTGVLQQTLDEQVDCAFDPNGKLLASMNQEGQITLWEIVSGTPHFQNLVARGPPLGSSSSNPSQQDVPEDDTGSRSSAFPTLPVVDPASAPNEIAQLPSGKTDGVEVRKITNVNPRKHERKGITALAMNPNGTRLASANSDGTVRLFDATTGHELLSFKSHGTAAVGVAFSGDGRRLISAGRDTEVRSSDALTGQLSQTLLGHEHPIRTVAISPDGRFVASGGEETRIMLWDATTGRLNNILNRHVDFVNSVAFSPDGKLLASAGVDSNILLWEVETGKLLRTLRGHSGEINSIAFSRRGLLASGGADRQIRIWNVETGQQVQALQGHQAAIRTVAFSPNGQFLASAGEDARNIIWNMANYRAQRVIPRAAINNALIFSPDGKSLIDGAENSQIVESDVETGQQRRSILLVPRPTRAPGPQSSNQTIGPNSPTAAAPSADTSLLQNALGWLLNWLVPAANAQSLPDPNQGPGGPILVVTAPSATYGKYYAEILRTEGFNAFTVADISTVSAATLNAYDVVILAPIPLSSTQVTLFANWVDAGGNLIAMKPDKQLAGLLGLIDAGATLSEGYLLVDTSKAPGNGIVAQTIQFHGTADRYTLNGASSLATLYADATTATADSALTLRDVGANGGQAAAFTYDLATSIVYTRQGNPAWAADERDGFPPIRSNDKFYGAKTIDPQPDWVDLNKVAIPQADEQQRLLANLILEMNRNKKPLPRFWYFPRGKKAVVVMTGDDHANNGTVGRFDQFLAASPAGCSVVDWECVRGTSYIFPNFLLTNTQAAAYEAQGFEVGLHINTSCGDFTPTQLATTYSQQIATFTNLYPSVPAPITQRHHCIVWSDWVTGAKVQWANGIRLDTSYYYWPPQWVQNRPGFFNGSAMPMRFADLDGAMVDVYNAQTQMTDESGQQYPYTIDTLLDRALGAEGYYGAFVINAHTDLAQIPESDAVLASAPSRGVPIVSSRQMLDWLDFRNTSSFGSLAWGTNTLSFTVVPGIGSQKVPTDGLQVLLPIKSPTGLLATVTRNGDSIPFTNQAIKGVDYAAFTGAAGSYVATYAADTTPPTVTATSPPDDATGVGQGTTTTVTFSEAVDSSTITGSTFELRDAGGALVPASISYNASTRTATLTPSASLAALTTFTATVKGGATDPRVKDLAGNPLAANVTWSFTTEAQPCASAPCSAWSSSTVPGTPSVNDPNPVELGVKFRTDLDGFITGIRFYQVNAGTYRGNLWTLGGQQLATGTVTDTGSGWKQVTFSAPVAITANTVYVASYHAPNGGYAATNSPAFSTAGVDNGPVHLLRDGVSGGNGVYAYGATSAFPANTYNGSNYWVDVVFVTSTDPDTTPPTVTARNPVPGATGVATGAVVTATFNEALDPTTINTTTFELRDATNALVPATVGYDEISRTTTLTPSSPLANSTAYTATLRGGTTDPRVKDLVGNALAANVTWSFTTTGATPVGCPGGSTIWAATTTPAVAAASDVAAVELGVKFRPTTNGYICGVRFYKGTGNSGTHVGKLWSSSGQLLASATFANETASGWQQVDFATPVAVTANTVYVASYHAPVGRYAIDSNYFATNGTSNGPLYAPRDGESGGNGVYLYGSGGFPTNTWNSSNYWVDVVFTTETGPDTTPPTVTATAPAADAAGVSPATAITATFSEALDPATVTSTTFELRDASNALVPASVSYNAGTVTLTPSGPLSAGTLYTATLKGGTDGIADLAGNALVQDVTWSFTTAAADTTPPTVTGQSPADGAVGVAPTTTVTVSFSEALDPATANGSTFELRDASNALVPASVSYNAATTTATLTPTVALATSTTYTATIKGGTSGVKDVAGNALAVDFTWLFTTGVDPCEGSNPIVCENAKLGNPASEWDVSGAGDSSIQGFATDISVNRGGTVNFKINTPSTDYRLDIYRMGYYGGTGARKVATVQPSATLPQAQPNCLTDAATGLIDCGNWAESASWAVPSDATSGIYFAKAIREDGNNAGRASHIVFIVRDDAGSADILFQTADTTWQAYNTYGGNSLYVGSPVGRAYKVSYNRPFNTRSVDNGQDWLFNAEYPMVRWLEANGYHVSYFTGVDSDRRGNLIQNHRIFLSIGHDEYWSDAQRANVEAARNAGVHLAFFSGNEVYWKTRWENSIDGSGTPYRTLVCYKETHAGAKIDPLPNVWTGTWRDPRFSPPADGGRPENALTGTLFTVNDGATTSIEVPAEDGKMRFWRNTSIVNLAVGAKATLPFGTLGYEWDEDIDNGFRPAGLIRLSTTTVNNAPVLVDYGSNFGSGTATHSLTLYKHSSGALVFGAGTVQWSWGLDSNHDRGSTAPDVRMQQATVNLFADMGVQPTTLQAGLVTATASTDTVAPVSAITSPTAGADVPAGSSVTISGTASDTGGVVGGVEVSVDGGTTWRRASGRANWSYTWTPTASGTVSIRSRAADDSGNLETPGASVTITVGSPTPPVGCSGDSLWPLTAIPAVVAYPETAAFEVGVKFQTNVNGYICGVRFYKGTGNSGTHVGKLWSSSGQLLASATFTNETASGWQQVDFASPVAIMANTVYVASYNAPNGRYAADTGYFATTGVTNGPLYALRDGESGGNGVYLSGSGGFPINTWQSSNYWVDVVFITSTGSDTEPPTAPSDLSAAATSATHIDLTWTAATDNVGVTGYQVERCQGTGCSTFAQIGTPTATNFADSGLTAGTTYQYRVRATDAAGNTSDYSAVASATTQTTSDLEPPTVTMTAPANGATVTGPAVTVTADASDNVGVTSVQFLLDGATLGAPATTAPYSITWDTTTATNGAHTLSARASDAAGNTATATAVSVTVLNSTNTGFLAPSANAAVTTNAGDNNGFETTPANAYTDDGLFAVDTNSGTNTNTSCTNAGKDKHIYRDYGVNLPSGAAINGIEVRLDARVNNAANNPRMCVQLSWNGGASWTAAKTTTTLSTTEQTYILGSAVDTWGRTWANGDFSNANFRLRVINIASSTARTFSLDWLAVRVTYQ